VSFFKTFATKGVGEIVKEAAIKAVSIAVPGTPVLASFAGAISKDLFEMLLTRTTEVERKLDKLLRQPLRTALQLLRDAAINPADTPQEIASRDSLLDAAHTGFVAASALTGDSREDSLFIVALDCIALAERTGRVAVATERFKETELELLELKRKIATLQRDAQEWSDHVQALNRFLRRRPKNSSEGEDWGEVPRGYGEQIVLTKIRERQANKVIAEADAASLRFEMLQSLVTLAKASLIRASAVANKF
jgi:hypothetical protein